jgi:hypothetical protein
MAENDEKRGIKITLEDLANVAAPDTGLAAATGAQTGARVYGKVSDAAGEIQQAPEEKGSIFLQGWFYLGLAGMLGALAGWGIAEPHFVDGVGGYSWGNFVILPLVVTLLCVGFAVAESIVERSPRKALFRGALSLPLGLVLGFLFDRVANLIYAIGISIIAEMGVQSARNPSVWIVRGFAWMIFGAAGGVVYGIIGQSSKKMLYGVLGGVIGAGLGGVVFDPIALMTKLGGPSRAVGFSLVGLAVGVGIGLVESALKDRWLYVTAGPLAGKQFILYKPRTIVGSDQKCDIYLFKDSNIEKEHAIVELAGSRIMLRAIGQTYVNGQPVRQQVLMSGAVVQIGRYAFRYQERHRN